MLPKWIARWVDTSNGGLGWWWTSLDKCACVNVHILYWCALVLMIQQTYYQRARRHFLKKHIRECHMILLVSDIILDNVVSFLLGVDSVGVEHRVVACATFSRVSMWVRCVRVCSVCVGVCVFDKGNTMLYWPSSAASTQNGPYTEWLLLHFSQHQYAPQTWVDWPSGILHTHTRKDPKLYQLHQTCTLLAGTKCSKGHWKCLNL